MRARETLAHYAAEEGHADMGLLLLEHGANHALHNAAGATPLAVATAPRVKAALRAAAARAGQ